MALFPSRNITLNNGTKLTIRNPIHEDAQPLVEYINQVSGESDNLSFGLGEAPFTKEQEEKYIESMKTDPHKIMAIGDINGEIVAVADISGPSLPRLQHMGELGISLKKKWWNLGVGTALMNYLLEWAKQAGLKKINLQVKEDNIHAIHLYKNHGFTEEGRRQRGMYINDRFYDLICMGMNL